LSGSNNPTLLRGRMAEYYVKRILERNGYRYIIRSFASLTPIDLIASNGADVIAVQVKVGGYMSRDAKTLLIEWAGKFHARAYLARKHRGRWVMVPVEAGRGEVSVATTVAPRLSASSSVSIVAPQSVVEDGAA
jgi:Holliday junction resolvase